MNYKHFGLVNREIFIPTLQPMVIDKINSFRDFKEGWHFGEGVVFSEDNISFAINLANFMAQNLFLKLDAFPGFNGEIMVTAYPEKYYFEFIVESPNQIEFKIEDENDNEVYATTINNLPSLKETIINQRNIFLWNTLGYSPSIIMTRQKGDLKAFPLETQQVGESQSSNVNAWLRYQDANVTIYQPNIRQPQAPLYSSNSVNLDYHLI